MAKHLEDWLKEDVEPVRGRSVRWLSERYFFRDPLRPVYSDLAYFFSPADGVVLYSRVVGPEEALVEIKGVDYTLRDALRDPHFEATCLVVGIFMTFYDVHVNRVPFPGFLSYRELEPIESFNKPMLDVELCLVDEGLVRTNGADYLHKNQRVVNRISAPRLQQSYYVLQIADFDVDSITPFELKQNRPVSQNERFSQIRYGSQVDLIIPISKRFAFKPLHEPGTHVEAGMDPLVQIREL